MERFLSRREILLNLPRGAAVLSAWILFGAGHAGAGSNVLTSKEVEMKLPRPRTKGQDTLEEVIKRRRTIRSFRSTSMTQDQLSQLLWAAQGITEERGSKRAAPSGGALYPIDVYAVVGAGGVEGVQPAIYRYEPNDHSVSLVVEGDLRQPLARASLSQMWMAKAPVSVVITSEYSRITSKYGERGVRYAMIEAGHVAQNIFLQAEALGMGAGIVGAFHDKDVIQVMKIPLSHEPLLILPIGYKI
jgi:SagB-type dehydrogenase family enzyme